MIAIRAAASSPRSDLPRRFVRLLDLAIVPNASISVVTEGHNGTTAGWVRFLHRRFRREDYLRQ